MELSLHKNIASPSEDLKEVAACSALQKRKTPQEGEGLHGETKKRKVNIDSDLIKVLVSSGCEYLVRYARNINGETNPEQSDDHKHVDGIVYPERLDGKAVVLICMWLPMHDKLALYLRNLKETYLAFCKEHNNQVEFVMAPLIDPKRDDSEEAFNEFAPSLPFLTMPYLNKNARLSVAKHARLSTDSYNENIFMVAFDTDGKEAGVPSYNIYRLLEHYSTDCYPFTKARLESLWEDRAKVKTLEGPFSMQSLFCCSSDTTDLGLTKLDGTPVSHTVSTLGKKHNNGVVGFYLCGEGDFLEELIKVHQSCKSDGNNFVIVLLYIPYERPADEDLNSFLNRINHKLSLLNINDEDWFVFPFNDPQSDRVCRRFWHLYPSLHGDMLSMLGPDGEYFDPDAREMIRHYGHKAFPFTKYRVKEDLLLDIESLTLKDFVPSASLTRPGPGPDPDRLKVVSLSEAVENKETILVLHCYEHNPESVDHYFKRLQPWYEAIKHSKCAGIFEVIVVCLLDSSYDAFVSKLPWLVARCNANEAATMRNKIERLSYSVGCTIVAFHKGKVISLHAQDYLSTSNPTGLLTDDEDLLESEVSAVLDDCHSSTVQSFFQVV